MQQEPLGIEDFAYEERGYRVLRLRGPVLISNLFEFQSKVRTNRSPALILDLVDVPYIDSAAVGALVGAFINHQKEGRSLALVGVNARIRHAMKIMHVESFFRFFDSRAEAETVLAMRRPA